MRLASDRPIPGMCAHTHAHTQEANDRHECGWRDDGRKNRPVRGTTLGEPSDGPQEDREVTGHKMAWPS